MTNGETNEEADTCVPVLEVARKVAGHFFFVRDKGNFICSQVFRLPILY